MAIATGKYVSSVPCMHVLYNYSLVISGSQSIIKEANHVAGNANLGYVISSLQQCNSVFFSDLYSSLTGVCVCALNFAFMSETEKCQALIEELELYMSPSVKLTHIKGSNLAKLDKLTIKHMLSVFSMLFKAHSAAIPCSTGGWLLIGN